jgi:two-component system KDP operon response regulator KdpE
VATASAAAALGHGPGRPFDATVVAVADAEILGVLAELRARTSSLIALIDPAVARVAQVLDAGADDCLVEPIDPDELLARLRAVLRRGRTEALAAAVVTPDFTMDLAERRLTRGGQDVHLTPTEWRIMELLAGQPDRVVSHEQMLRAIWGPAKADQLVYLRVYVAALRRKLEPDRRAPLYLVTEPGFGYRFRPRGAGT